MKPLRLLAPLAVVLLVGCETESPTMVVVDNDYPAVPDGGDSSTGISVFKVWWVTSLLPEPVAAGGEGQPERTVPNADFAYAILAVGWDPSSPTPPARLIAAKSSAKLSVARGDTLHVHVSDATFTGNCAAGKPLSQGDADFITQRIFPGDFAGTYDAKTCAGAPLVAGGGADAGSLDDASSTDAGEPEAGAD